MPRSHWGIVPVIACALAAAGCGSSAKDDTPRLTKAQSATLVAQLERARVTAAAHDLEGTTAALKGFRQQVARLARAGALSQATARALRLGATRALGRAASDNAPPKPAPAATTPAPTAPPPGQAKKEKKKHHGKGKGDQGDEGD